MIAPASRRGFLRGFASLAAIGGTAAALPAVAAPTAPHPDQALFDAEEVLRQAVARHVEASAANRAAQAAYAAALGPCPNSLRLTDWEERAFCGYGTRIPGIGHVAVEGVPAPRLPDEDPDTWHNCRSAWTPRGLRHVIDRAPALLGPAGRTPHRIRYWRSLLPEAEARDARRQQLRARFDTARLYREEEAAGVAVSEACARIDGMVATTVEGLAVKARHLDAYSWRKMSACWRTLFESAVAITGITPRQPEEWEL